MSENCGFVYVVNTQKYLEEALVSLASLRRHMPSAAVAIITHEHLFREDPSVCWVPLSQNYDTPIVKCEAIRCPFDRFVFLDTDTRVVRDVSKIFEPLDAFDCALAHEPTRGWDYLTKSPDAFCELNTGVMAFRKSHAVAEFFELWRATYDRMRAEQGLLNDQPSFREALWSSENIRLCTLPSEFHLVTGKPAYIAWDAHILHGRDNLAAVESVVNRCTGPRALMPTYGLLMPCNGRKSLFRTWRHITRLLLEGLILQPRSAPAAAPGDWQLRAVAIKKPG